MGSIANHEAAVELFEGQNILYMQIFGHLKPLCLKWVVELGIPDIIHNHGKPVTLSHLVSALKVPPSKTNFVQRLMRFLAHNEIFDIHHTQEDHEVAYALTPASKLLVSGSGHCLSPMVRLITDPFLMSKYHHLGEWISSEDPTLYETAIGTSVWGLLEREPKYLSLFSEGMASDSQMVDLALKNFNSVFENLDSIVDVGGGTGTTARIISEAYPKLKCVVLDLPPVIANSTGTNNLTFVGGDMFKCIPQADAILLKVQIYVSDFACLIWKVILQLRNHDKDMFLNFLSFFFFTFFAVGFT